MTGTVTGCANLSNTATASTTTTQSDALDLTDTETTAVACPAIDVEKSVSVDGGTTYVDADTVTGPSLLSGFDDPQFRFVVTNTGNVALSSVTLTDSDPPSTSPTVSPRSRPPSPSAPPTPVN